MDQAVQATLDRIDALAPATSTDADDATWLAAFRCQTAMLREFSGAAEPVARIDHLVADGVVIRLYRPRAGPLPVILHLHGGGAIAGSVDGHDPVLRTLANRTGWAVAAPAYRLAPDHRFPAQLDDAATALAHLHARGEDLGLDTTRIVVSGDSIGGTLATALAARTTGLSGQMLFYPNTDLRRDAVYPSRRRHDGVIIARDALERQIDLYLADPAQRQDPAASPIRADVAGLPPTLIVTCGADPLADEGIAYADRMRGAGVAVDHEHVEGMIHAALQMRGAIPAADALFDRAAAWLARISPRG